MHWPPFLLFRNNECATTKLTQYYVYTFEVILVGTSPRFLFHLALCAILTASWPKQKVCYLWKCYLAREATTSKPFSATSRTEFKITEFPEVWNDVLVFHFLRFRCRRVLFLRHFHLQKETWVSTGSGKCIYHSYSTAKAITVTILALNSWVHLGNLTWWSLAIQNFPSFSPIWTSKKFPTLLYQGQVTRY